MNNSPANFTPSILGEKDINTTISGKRLTPTDRIKGTVFKFTEAIAQTIPDTLILPCILTREITRIAPSSGRAFTTVPAPGGLFRVGDKLFTQTTCSGDWLIYE